MTKSIEEQAEENYKSIPWQFVNNQSFQSVHNNAFIAGAKARDEQWLAVVNELESLMYNNPNVRQDAYNQGVRDCIRRFAKADQLLKEMEFAICDVEQLKAENNDLKRELADKNKYGCCIVEHGYRMESEQCLKDITKQLENSRAEITALKSKLEIAVEALEYVAAEGDRSGSRFRSERQHDLAIAGQALTEIGGEI